MEFLPTMFDINKVHNFHDMADNISTGYAFYLDNTFSCLKEIAKVYHNKVIGRNYNLLRIKLNTLMKNLVTLIHVGSGQPMRGTEFFRSLDLVNGQFDLRNVYFSFGRLCIVQTYNKTMNPADARKLIIRYMPLIVSNILIVTTCIITPTLCHVLYY